MASIQSIWIQYICKFCLVYYLKDLGAFSKSHSSFLEMHVFFSMQKTALAIKFQKCFCVTQFQKFITDYHLE